MLPEAFYNFVIFRLQIYIELKIPIYTVFKNKFNVTQDSSRPTYFKEHFYFFEIWSQRCELKRYIFMILFLCPSSLLLFFMYPSTSGLRITGWKTLINKRPSGISCKWHVQNVKIKACTYIISCDNTYSTRDECKIWLSF